ncbi:MAG: Gfo/Idh/MocA family oxidoreductase [Clostridia bacterium]|nr:Gfo/Idh/MocA family oxidoreductase [Clostridia bacterium]
MKQYNVGVIGLGSRGGWWVGSMLADLDYVEITGLCDVYEDRIEASKKALRKKGRPVPPVLTQDWRALIDAPDVEVVLVFSSWGNHVEAAIRALRAGKPVAIEVGGASGIEECRALVEAQEQTGTPFMLLENCCYGEYELMALNMARHGLFGDIVHCDGGYLHDLRDEIGRGNETRHYRFNEYLTGNRENYPTHEIGPIAKILGINNGNRFVSLVSVASRAAGLHAYIEAHADLRKKYAETVFRQGDIVKTVITCADGSTVALTLDTTLPRYYSRGLCVRGTKGFYEEATQSVFLDGEKYGGAEWDWAPQFGNRKKYLKRWDHPIWKRYRRRGVKEQGHGGMDFLVIDAFFEALDKGLPMPIDVYDAATWMAISALSAESIKNGSQSVPFPDFTHGAWKTQREEPDWKYRLEPDRQED